MSNAGMSISSPKWKMRQVDNHPKPKKRICRARRKAKKANRNIPYPSRKFVSLLNVSLVANLGEFYRKIKYD